MSAALTARIKQALDEGRILVSRRAGPAAYHQLVARGEATHDLHRFITVVVGWTLLPFALSIGIDLFVAVAKVAPGPPAVESGEEGGGGPHGVPHGVARRAGPARLPARHRAHGGVRPVARLSRYVHLASLGAIALTTVLLIAPAAYYRIVERGEDTPAFLRFASATLVASLVTLGLRMAGDLYVVVGKVTRSRAVAVAAGGHDAVNDRREAA